MSHKEAKIHEKCQCDYGFKKELITYGIEKPKVRLIRCPHCEENRPTGYEVISDEDLILHAKLQISRVQDVSQNLVLEIIRRWKKK